MTGAGRRIFIHAGPGRKKARNEIHPRRSGSGGDHAQAIQFRQGFEVGAKFRHFLRGGKDREVIAGLEYGGGCASQTGGQPSRGRASFRRSAGKIELDNTAPSLGGQPAAPGVKTDDRSGILLFGKQDVRRCQSGVAAQIHFKDGRKPTQINPLGAGDEKGRFSQVVFGGDGLHGGVRQPGGERAHAGGISAESLVREGIHLIIRNSHAAY